MMLYISFKIMTSFRLHLSNLLGWNYKISNMAAAIRTSVICGRSIANCCWQSCKLKSHLVGDVSRKAVTISSPFTTQTQPDISTNSPEISVDSTKSKLPMSEVIDPLKHPDFFEVRNFFTVKDLFDARVHLGHEEGTLNDHMRPYLFGSRLGHLIFDLDLTAQHLRSALNFIAHIAYRKGIILFVNRNPHASYFVEQMARDCGEYAHTRIWFRGVLTNANLQFGAITRLPDLVVGFSSLSRLLETHEAVTSAAKMLIPSVAVVDTNSDPTLVTYPIPGNDDSPMALQLYCDLFKKAVLAGKQKRREMEEKGLVSSDE